MSVIARHPPVNTISMSPLDHLVAQNISRTPGFSGSNSTASAVAAAADDIISSSSLSSASSASSLSAATTSMAQSAPMSSSSSSIPTDVSTSPKLVPSANASSPSPKKLSNPVLSTHLTAPTSSPASIISPIARPSGPGPAASLSPSPPPMSPSTMAARFNIVTGSSASAGSKVFARDDLETVVGSGLQHHSNLVRNLSVLIVPEPDEEDLKADANMKEAEAFAGKTFAEPEEEGSSDSLMSPVVVLSPKEESMATAISSVTTAFPEVHPQQLTHRLTWSVATEKGYRRLPNLSSMPNAGNSSPTTAGGYPRHSIHPDLEDVHWPPAVSDAPHLLASWSTLESANSVNASTSLETSTVSLASSVDSNAVDADEELRRVRSRSDSAGSNRSVVSRGSSVESVFSGLPDGTAIVEESKGGVVRSMVESLSGTTRLFVLADGHGGVSAARFFVPRVRDSLLELMTSRPWDFGISADRNLFTQESGTLFKILDTEYCAMQVAAYRRWVDAGSIHGCRPADDGCTMVAVVIHGDHAVCLNVGDSRAVVVCKDDCGDEGRDGDAMDEDLRQARWTPVFSTEDHNMCHPGKVWDIHRSGGHFINPNGTLKHVVVSPPEQRRFRPYDELNGARIYRHPTDAVRAVGVSHKRTLNLTATMGDLLFKIEPAILSPVPDVRFVPLMADKEYLLVLATDGVWDHMRTQSSSDDQNDVAVRVVAGAVASLESRGEEGFLDGRSLTERLEGAARALVLRETDVDVTLPPFVRERARDVFLRGQIRYDDATALVVYLEPVRGAGLTNVAAAALV
ncbi:Protein phosphatase 1D [Dinochytrium kinnereticum]|nr:Protein phosphatase 1D [Dinochytrium kinnereticum]